MLRAFIVDDEVLARDLVRRLLRHEEDVEVVGEADNGGSAVRDIRRLQPDLVFLDVQMPGISGIDVGKKLGDMQRPYIVYVTAYDRYAIDAFEVQALDYLLKPLRATRFAAAVQRARRALSTSGRSPGEGHLSFRQGRHQRAIAWSDIQWIESANQYVKVHTEDDEYLLSRSLSSLEKLLPADRFVRIHRSTLVNVACVDGLVGLGNGQHAAVLLDGRRLTIGRNRREALQRLLPHT